VSSVAV
jgi:hypothetical protein